MYKSLLSVLAIASAVVASPALAAAGVLVPAAAQYQKSVARDLGERAAQVNPTISFYTGINCASGGIRNSIVDRLQQTCLKSTPPTFGSVLIENPDRLFLPYTIWVSFTGSTCPTGIVQIPQTNTCYNLTPTGNGWFIRNTGGGTF